MHVQCRQVERNKQQNNLTIAKKRKSRLFCRQLACNSSETIKMVLLVQWVIESAARSPAWSGRPFVSVINWSSSIRQTHRAHTAGTDGYTQLTEAHTNHQSWIITFIQAFLVSLHCNVINLWINASINTGCNAIHTQHTTDNNNNILVYTTMAYCMPCHIP